MFIYFRCSFHCFFLGDELRILRNVHRQMWMWNGSSADVVSKNVLFKRALEAAKGQSGEWMRKRCWKLSCAVTKGALYLHVISCMFYHISYMWHAISALNQQLKAVVHKSCRPAKPGLGSETMALGALGCTWLLAVRLLPEQNFDEAGVQRSDVKKAVSPSDTCWVFCQWI